jgi:hypothetical protein
MIRLRPMRETITLVDCIPEICLINANDGTSAYLRWIIVCHHARELPCNPANWTLIPDDAAMMTFSQGGSPPLVFTDRRQCALSRLPVRKTASRRAEIPVTCPLLDRKDEKLPRGHIAVSRMRPSATTSPSGNMPRPSLRHREA